MSDMVEVRTAHSSKLFDMHKFTASVRTSPAISSTCVTAQLHFYSRNLKTESHIIGSRNENTSIQLVH